MTKKEAANRIEELENLLRSYRICPYCGKQLSKVESESVHTCSQFFRGE